MNNPLRRKQLGKTYLEALDMAKGFALEDTRLMSFCGDLVKPGPTLGEHGEIKLMLKQRGFIREAEDEMDSGVKMWVITELGRNYLASL